MSCMCHVVSPLPREVASQQTVLLPMEFKTGSVLQYPMTTTPLLTPWICSMAPWMTKLKNPTAFFSDTNVYQRHQSIRIGVTGPCIGVEKLITLLVELSLIPKVTLQNVTPPNLNKLRWLLLHCATMKECRWGSKEFVTPSHSSPTPIQCDWCRRKPYTNIPYIGVK